MYCGRYYVKFSKLKNKNRTEWKKKLNAAQTLERSELILFDTRTEFTQGLGVIQLRRLAVNEVVEKMAEFIVELTLEV